MTPEKNIPTEQDAALVPATDDRDSLTLPQLARAVLDRTLRPRTADIRRLAEGLLAKAGPKKGKKKKSSADKADKKGGGKKRKMAKIPQPQA